MQFVIIHGSFGTPQENWFPYLKSELEQKGHQVIVPQFPVEDWDVLTGRGENAVAYNQNLANWLKTFEPFVNELQSVNPVFIGHSIGCLFILHVVSHFNLTTTGAIFAAPFLTKLNKAWQIDTVNATFYNDGLNFNQLKQYIPRSTIFYANDDPYVDSIFSQTFAQKMSSQVINFPTGGHLNARAGFTQFPQLLEECLAYTS